MFLERLGHLRADLRGQPTRQLEAELLGDVTAVHVDRGLHQVRVHANRAADPLPRYQNGAGLTVFDRVVSSYTPSLTALADTVTTPPPQHARPTALTVGVSESKGVPTLLSARDEAEAMAALLPGSTVLIDSAASADAIKEGLQDHAIAHFACHGRAVSSDGNTHLGGLMLINGWFRPSFVRDLRTTQAQLAFLSACDTASPDPALLDEPLNLASAFHLAGFRGVIGTQWHTADSTETAVAVYAALTAHGTRPADTAQAAAALTETSPHEGRLPGRADAVGRARACRQLNCSATDGRTAIGPAEDTVSVDADAVPVGGLKRWARSRSRGLRHHRSGLNGLLCGWYHYPRVRARQGYRASGAGFAPGGRSVGSQCRLLLKASRGRGAAAPGGVGRVPGAVCS
ncbi:CHAT domain-containing protein [Streptomyces mirabilis]|uniref:CHAT domain-containing protein n=1 Tax=Streptomyces mirabilis TaxID=68239 RepID=UPI003689E3F2